MEPAQVVENQSVEPRPLEPEPGLCCIVRMVVSLQRCPPRLLQRVMLSQFRIAELLCRQIVPDRNGYEGNTLFPHDDAVETLEGVYEEGEEMGSDGGG